MASIVESPDNAWRVHPVSQLGLLVDACDYYREFYRAALRAQRYILLSGWQFDSEVELLRGPEAEQSGAPVRLLPFLNYLCEQKQQLQILVLAWDFHLVFAIEREWMQQLVFDWNTSPRLRFKFDGHHVENGSHHQKFVVIDDQVAFLGGIDLCDHRWDDRRHESNNPLRISRGAPHRPFHDVQVYLRGPEVAASMTELFMRRWELAGADAVEFAPAGAADAATPAPTPSALLPVAASRVALSRTDPYGTPDRGKPCFEIRDQYLAAIATAETLIYIETQYFSSHVIGDALERRMRNAGKPHIEIVLVLNMKGETLKEQAAVGLAQAQLIGRMREVAQETGHALGIYYTLPDCRDADQIKHTTYIHSKLMIVDDRFLIVGSANLTNRSMAVDTELNASVEAESADGALGASLRHIRLNLLAEHTGAEELTPGVGLVAQLDGLVAQREGSPICRLRRHTSPTPEEQTILALIDPQKLPFDPDSFEEFDQDKNFTMGIKRLFQSLGGK